MLLEQAYQRLLVPSERGCSRIVASAPADPMRSYARPLVQATSSGEHPAALGGAKLDLL